LRTITARDDQLRLGDASLAFDAKDLIMDVCVNSCDQRYIAIASASGIYDICVHSENLFAHVAELSGSDASVVHRDANAATTNNNNSNNNNTNSNNAVRHNDQLRVPQQVNFFV
jgi:hypothetical protein